MTRKDYILIANCISRNSTIVKGEGIILKEGLIEDLVYDLKGDNSNFDIAKFKKACE